MSETTTPTSKRCTGCSENKMLTAFPPDKCRSDGRKSACRRCNTDRTKQYYHHNKAVRLEACRWNQKRALYQMSKERYVALFDQQGGRCAICDDPISFTGKNTHIDHDHSCCPGKRSCGQCIRGLLCAHCNRMLGQVKESVKTLLAAVEYLERIAEPVSSPHRAIRQAS